MVGVRMLSGAAWRESVILLACLVVQTSHAAAQTATLHPLPGPSGDGYRTVDQVTRDGTRAVVTVGVTGASGPPADTFTQVIDTRTGAVVFDSRPVRSPARSYASLRLSPDGAWFADTELTGVGTVLVTRLQQGEQRVAFVDVFSDVEVRAVSNGATRVAVASGSGGSLVGTAFAVGGEATPVRHFGSFCRPAAPERCPHEPLTMSADGRWLTYLAGNELMLADVDAATAETMPVNHPGLRREPLGAPRISGDGKWVGFTALALIDRESRAAVVARESGQVAIVTPGRATFHDLSDDGRFVLLTQDDVTAAGAAPLVVVDRVTGMITRVSPADAGTAGVLVDAHLSGDGRTVVVTTARSASPTDFGRSAQIARLDVDGDGMGDGWETTFGLDPADPNDASIDADGDGASNAQEYAAGRHPRGTPIRYFAEGANGAFFATSLALFNPTDADVTANVRSLGPEGATISKPVLVAAHGPAYLDADHANLPFTEFSIVVESPSPLVTERRMTWDRMGHYGSHSSGGVSAPARTWYFAEGATTAGFQTFVLLQNPNSQPATVTLQYLLATGTTSTRTHVVPAQSRLTIWTNQEGAPLDAAEFATVVSADLPIVTERAMYRDAPDERLAAGSVTAGVATPATSWFFAEGATGAFFDTYLLLSNPGNVPARVTTRFIRAFDPANPTTAAPISRWYLVPPRSRYTIWVAKEAPELLNVEVSSHVEADQPIIAERSMWWPGPTSATWRENHTDTGATVPSDAWVAADLPTAIVPGEAEAFLLVGYDAPMVSGPRIRVSLSCADGVRAERVFELPTFATRATLWLRQEFPEASGRRCAATLESLPVRPGTWQGHPIGPAPIVVESAVYGQGFAAGSATQATPINMPGGPLP